MPPSGRKAKTRARRVAPAAEAQQHEQSDAETPEAIATPSRASRKHARATEPTAAPAARNTRRKTKDTRNLEREDTEGTEPGDASDNDTEPALPNELEIIASLRVADRQVNATEDFANDLLEGQENVPGYGKIAGRDWAFIIRKVEVNIGRPEAHEKLAVEEAGGQSAGLSHKTVVDIDLGPDRQVSRSHAIIAYDGDTSSWFIIVNGRNGLRVDNNLLKRGAKSYLRNGSVIEIASTQMAFITTATEEGEGPIWDASILRQAMKSSEEDDNGFDESKQNGSRQHGHPQHRGQLHDTGRHPPQYNGQQQQQRTHPHSQRAAAAMQNGAALGPPGTPLRPTTATMPKSSPSGYARGITMESTESIDYSSSSAKDLKPPHSYAQLIGMAILSTQEQQMTLSNIYKWIMANYAFYRFNTGGWQNSIRHNLSLNKAFTKIARRTDEPGKGMKWMIEPTEFDNFVQQGMKGCRRPPLQASFPNNGTQSTLASPSSPLNAIRNPGSASANPSIKRNPDSATPPMHPAYRPSYPLPNEAFTPDRGSHRHVGLGISEPNLASAAHDPAGTEAAYNLDFLRSTPRNGLTAAAMSAGSPPALYVNDEGRVGPMDTPFPLRPTARFAPPSTLRRPSDFIQFSSPAPFWKMDGLVGSTPFKPYDVSPLKAPFPSLKPAVGRGDTTADEDDDEPEGDEPVDEEVERDNAAEGAEAVQDTKAINDAYEQNLPQRPQSPIIPSSSPPRAASSGPIPFPGAESPTTARPSTAGAKGLNLLAAATKEAEREQQQRPETAGGEGSTATGSSFGGAGAVSGHWRPSSALSGGSSSAHNVNGWTHPQQSHQQMQSGMGYPPPLPQQQSQQLQREYRHPPPPPATGAAAVDEEDEGIDLVKGFQPIGSFHQRSHLNMGGPLGGGVPPQPLGVGGFGR